MAEGSDTHYKARTAYTAVQTGSGLIPGSAIVDEGVDTAQLAADAVDQTKLAHDFANLGTSTHDDASALTLIPAVTVPMSGICTVKCTETIVDGGGGAPTFEAGNGTAAAHFVASSEYAAAGTAGNRFTFGFDLEVGESLVITNTNGTGGDAGAFLHHVNVAPITI